MASGKTHDNLTLLGLIPIGWTCLAYYHLGLNLTGWVLAGTFIGGFYLSPDLDIKSRPFYRWGILRFIWWPYQWAFKHRSVFSHGLIWAAGFRLLYASAALFLLYMALRFGLKTWLQVPLPKAHLPSALILQHCFLAFLTGIWLGAFLHIVVDQIYSKAKVVLKPLRRQNRRKNF